MYSASFCAYFYFDFFFLVFLYSNFIGFSFVLQPSSCLSDREEDEIYGLTTAERRFPPAAAAVRPPVHLTTAIRQHTVQQPWVHTILLYTLHADYYTISILPLLFLLSSPSSSSLSSSSSYRRIQSILTSCYNSSYALLKTSSSCCRRIYVRTTSPTVSLLKPMQI